MRQFLTQHRRTAQQFVLFAVVGVVNTAVSFGTYYAATRAGRLDPLVGNVVAFFLAVTVSFILNRTFTFRGSTGALHHQYGKFLLINVVGLGISEFIIWLFHHRLGMNDLLAFVIATGIVLFWNFGANRRWTFNGR